MRIPTSGWLIRASLILAIGSAPLFAQLTGFSKEDLIKYTPDVPFERFPDGRPKVPDNFIEALKNFMYWENYDVRVRMDGKIDRVVLEDIRKNRKRGAR